MTDTATMLDPQRSPHRDISAGLSAAARKAGSWEVQFRPANPGPFPARVLARRRELLKLETELASLPPAGPDADLRTIALQDMRTNPRLLRSAITAANIKPQDMAKLPRVMLPNQQNEPRVASV